jgi:putative thymidine phosphorylase
VKVRNLKISTGGIQVVLLRKEDANKIGVRHGDRICVESGKKKAISIIDITDDSKLIKKGEIGFFKEINELMKLKTGNKVSLSIITKPRSVYHIAKKLRGERLNEEDMNEIIKDITDKKLTDIETTYFVSACYMQELTNREIISFIHAMINNGKKLNFGKKIVADKHCIGGVPGNRTTCIVVPIIAAAGYLIPKTSSRSITSPAGTSDTMEVLCDIMLSISDMKKVVKSTKACMVWGGAMDVAPSDDILIKVEHPLSLDPIGQMLASVLAKKKAVGSTHCLIDIPVGKGAKIESRIKARKIKRKFEKVGKAIGMKVKVTITDGSEPIGNGIGPALEARDLLWTLKKDKRGSKVLLDKGTYLAGKLLKLLGEPKPFKLAKKIVDSGLAEKKFFEILKAQGIRYNDANKIPIGKYRASITANHSGKIKAIDNRTISRIARLAGAPSDITAGLYIYTHKKQKVSKGDILFTIYSNSAMKLKCAKDYALEKSGYVIK